MQYVEYMNSKPAKRPSTPPPATGRSGTYRLSLPKDPLAPVDRRLVNSSDLRGSALTLYALLDAEEEGREADARFLLAQVQRELRDAAARRADPETVRGRAGKILAAVAAEPAGLSSTELARQFPRDAQVRRRLEQAGRLVREVVETSTRPRTIWRLPR